MGRDINPKRVLQIKEREENDLLSIEGVVGTGIGKNQNNEYCIKVYVKKVTEKILKKIPKKIEGIDVEIIESGEITTL